MNNFTSVALPDINKLKQHIKGKIVLPSHRLYQQSCQQFNRAIHHTPALFVFVQQASDIRRALNYARKHELNVSVRGGGHSAVGSSLINNGMVIDMRALNQIKVSPQTKTANVGAGALLHEVENATDRYNLVLPMGTCSSVGVVGSTLGGGIGFLSRKYGLLCDNVKQFTLLNAASEFIQVDQENHPDLFWALRGAGANQFGVVTQVNYALYDRPKEIYGGTISWPVKIGKEILRHYRDLLASAPDDLFLYAFISHAPKADAMISLMGFYLADSKKSEQLFDTMRCWATPSHTDLAYRPYRDLQSGHFEEELAVHWKHGFISDPLSDDFIDLFIEIFNRCPDNGGGIMLDPLGGQINRVDKSATAFIHRDSQFVCSITGLYPGRYIPKPIKEWVEQSHQDFSPYFNGYAYQNYEDLDLDEANSYYGKHVDRLKQLKSKYDPDNLFPGSLTR